MAAVAVVDPDLPVRVPRRHGHVEGGGDGVVEVDGEVRDPEAVDGVLGKLGIEDEVENARGGGDGDDEDDDGEQSPAHAPATAAPPSPRRRQRSPGQRSLRRRLFLAAGEDWRQSSGRRWRRGLDAHRVDSLVLRHGALLKICSRVLEEDFL